MTFIEFSGVKAPKSLLIIAAFCAILSVFESPQVPQNFLPLATNLALRALGELDGEVAEIVLEPEVVVLEVVVVAELNGMHCEYQSLVYWQADPASHVVLPSQKKLAGR